MVFSHIHNAQGQGGGSDHGQSFWDRSYGKGDRSLEHLKKPIPPQEADAKHEGAHPARDQD